MALRTLFFFSLLVLSPIPMAKADPVDIAIVADGPSSWNDQVLLALRDELDGLGDRDFSFRFPSAHQYQGQWTLGQSRRAIDRALQTPSIEIVIVLGVVGSSLVADYTPAKALIATSVINPRLQGFPVSENGSSGVNNLHYLATNVDPVAELKRFQQATGAQHIAVMTAPSVFKAIPVLAKSLGDNSNRLGFKVSFVESANEDMDDFVASLPADLDGLLILPQSGLSEIGYRTLIEALIAARIPAFTTLGRESVEAGFLMGTGMIPSPTLLARQLAVDIRDIALGREAGDLPVSLDIKNRLIINMATAREIDYEPPFSLLFEAEVLNDFKERGRTLSLFAAVEESLQRNLSLALAQKDLQSAEQDTRIARSPLLPQLSADADWRSQDRDLAGIGPTRTSTLGLSLRQSIYSESDRGNYYSTRYLQQAEAASLQTTRLDVIRDTAEAYLNLLIAKTERDIQFDNLKLTRANLERAQFRYDVGSTDRSEVHRFETELGSDQQSMSSAQSQYFQQIGQLNQILHRPIDDPFQTREPGLSEPIIFADQRLDRFIVNQRQVKLFSSFLTQQSLANAPELVSLENEIASRKRLLLAAQRKRYVPDVDFVASSERIVDDDGARFATDYDDDWSVGVEFSWKLYEGSSIAAEKSQQRIELQRLELQYRQAKDSLETDTRNSVFKATSSRMNIGYAQASAEAAEKTLNLVTDAYVRGTSSYIDLIDAQSAYLTARLSSANAIYEHLLDLIALQRAIGFFDFYVAPAEKEAWFDQLEQFARSYRTKR